MTEEQSRAGPHQGQPILVAGEQLEGDPLEQTHVAMILLHGRGATADSSWNWLRNGISRISPIWHRKRRAIPGTRIVSSRLLPAMNLFSHRHS